MAGRGSTTHAPTLTKAGALVGSRNDPFAEVWPVLMGWFQERPDMEAKAMLKKLQTSGYGEFPDSQLLYLPTDTTAPGEVMTDANRATTRLRC
jgi:hypothetical protein